MTRVSLISHIQAPRLLIAKPCNSPEVGLPTTIGTEQDGPKVTISPMQLIFLQILGF